MASHVLLTSSWQRVLQSHRPPTNQAHRTHLKTYLAFWLFANFKYKFPLTVFCFFGDYLQHNHISMEPIRNYFFQFPLWKTSIISSLQINSVSNRFEIAEIFGSTKFPNYKLVFGSLRREGGQKCVWNIGHLIETAFDFHRTWGRYCNRGLALIQAQSRPGGKWTSDANQFDGGH